MTDLDTQNLSTCEVSLFIIMSLGFQVRAIQGVTYMLNQDEELWAKELPPAVENLLTVDALAERGDRRTAKDSKGERDKTRVVNYRVPHNAAVQIYDYKEKKAR